MGDILARTNEYPMYDFIVEPCTVIDHTCAFVFYSCNYLLYYMHV